MEIKDKPRTIRVETGSIMGGIWAIGWLFTMAYAHLIWWQAILAVVVWPYYLGLVVH